MRFLNVFLIYLLLISTLPGQTPPGRLDVVVIDGNDATSNIATHTMHSVTILVQDEAKRPVKDARVMMHLPADGPGGSFAFNGDTYLAKETDSQGRVILTGMKLRNATGQYTIRVDAKKDGQFGSATLTQTAADLPVTGQGWSKRTWVILAIIGGGAAAGIAAGIYSNSGSSNSGPGFSVTPGNPTVTGPH